MKIIDLAYLKGRYALLWLNSAR